MVNRESVGPPIRSVGTPLAKEIDYPESMLQFFILKVWQRLLGREDIGINDDFIGAGGDLALLDQMLATVQTAVGQKIPSLVHQRTYTIREIEAAILREGRPPAELIKLARKGHGVPLLFCHGDYAMRGLYALKLVETLTSEHPTYLLHPYPNPDPKMTIEEMAQAYIPEILARHPEGSFRFVGYCNGGQLAWEIAHQLERLGRQIDFIVLIETISLNARMLLRALGRLIRIIVAITPPKLSEKVSRDWMNLGWKRTCRRSAPNPYMPAVTPYSRALRNYVPPRINAPVVCILSDESRNRIGLSPIPWNNVAPSVDCLHVAGNHLNDLNTLISDVTPMLNELLTHSPSHRKRDPRKHDSQRAVIKERSLQ